MRTSLPVLLSTLLLSGLGAVSSVQASPQRLLDQGDSVSTLGQVPARSMSGWLLITPDKDWQAKWNTPPENVPHFNEAEVVEVGQPLNVLLFFANPSLSAEKQARLTMTISLVRPDGTLEMDEDTSVCLIGPVAVEPQAVRMCDTVLGLVPTKEDLKGVWTLKATLNDERSGTRIPLTKTFRLR